MLGNTGGERVRTDWSQVLLGRGREKGQSGREESSGSKEGSQVDWMATKVKCQSTVRRILLCAKFQNAKNE